ncbi:LacI family DNA-binding transcriptional regulator [Pectinatus sottacetonis]|uniref:LacI family DNA-binding transcriptional regulator n=1 Tax=Pectinatus sottacetonis TaxID=1002795 RepID=UPI0018C63410|nr:LacI family DNA-binding transcriptional regulator [Pectinatus sottacetonis]
MTRTTIKDIANAAGVSVTTVSLVLNGKSNRISAKNRRLIKDIAQKMNYRPNKLAVGLIKKITNTIGLIIPDISNVFFSEITKGIEDFAHKKSYNLILCNSNDNHALEIESINMLIDQSIDGLIIIMSAESYGTKEQASLSLLKKASLPTVIIDCFNETDNFSTVSINNTKASYMAVEYLISLNHKRIACITGPLGPQTNTDRLNGYIKALQKHAIPYRKELIYEGNFRYQSGYNAISVLLPQRPTAILCLNDMMAYGAIKALKEQGINVPNDISVMGFDDIFFSQILEVPLSTISQPAYTMGKKAAELLLDDLTEHTPPKHIIFEPVIKIRQSTKKYQPK